jgi:hypothetical protein
MSFFQNIWDCDYDWVLSGNTWIKKRRNKQYEPNSSLPIDFLNIDDNDFFVDSIENDPSIENLEDIYWKYQKCLSGITYQYVVSKKPKITKI